MKSKINFKLFFFLAAIISLILTILSLLTTYSRYVTSITAKSYVELGKWLILINNQDITDNSDISSVLTPVFDKSDYIAEGNLVPTSSGSVTIDVNYEGVTVPFSYEISFSSESTPIMKDLKLVSYNIDDGKTILVEDIEIIDSEHPSPIITGTISPDIATRISTFKLNFAWVDGDGEVFNDVQDTVYTHNVDEIGLRFNMKFTQVI